jgi:alpha/beta superfamily hydrolase
MVEEERIFFNAKRMRIEGLLSVDKEFAKGGVIICHRHPLFGGTMYNNVVTVIARIATMWDFTSLRFNFRGVGESGGTFGGGTSEQEDVRGAIDYLEAKGKPPVIILAGYSFGAIAGLPVGVDDERVRGLIGVAPPLEMFDFGFLRKCLKPKLFVCGEHDTICPPSKMEEFFETLSGPKWLRILPGIDHFYYDRKGLLEGAMGDFLERMVQP